jgi:tRNA nucleotidyltransferase (CCA-adding enzyme)
VWVKKIEVPSEVLNLLSQLNKAGFEAYVVGGCVRDSLLGIAAKDWDITTSANPEQIQAVFPDSFYENNFGTVGVKTDSSDPALSVIEVTPFRTDGEYSNNRHPDTVQFGTSLHEDLKRRDFTVNALAYDPLSDTLIDEQGGLSDLQTKTLRTVGTAHDRFTEDALRMMRALRLSAQLNFALDSETLMALATHTPSLSAISAERIRDELLKILATDSPLQALFVAQKLGILKVILPELEEAVGCTQNQAHSFDVFEHLLRTMQHAADQKWSLQLRLAALLHDIGKPRTRDFNTEKGDYTFYGHEVVGARITKKILERLRISKEMSLYVVTMVRWHMFFSDPDQITLSAVRRIVAKVGKEHIVDLINLRVCDRIGTGRPKAHPFRLRKYMAMIDEVMRDPIHVGMLKVDGAALMAHGIAAGPRMGWILHALLEEVLDDPTKNEVAILLSQATHLNTLEDTVLRSLGDKGKESRDEKNEAEIQVIQRKHKVG